MTKPLKVHAPSRYDDHPDWALCGIFRGQLVSLEWADVTCGHCLKFRPEGATDARQRTD